jgi:hypothetical protein
MADNICHNCRWWQGDRDEYGDDAGSCSMIHVGSGNRKWLARLYPVGSPAWLETDKRFYCKLHEAIPPR